MAKFGKDFRQKYFSFEEGVTPINNGSYGAIPTRVYDRYKQEMHKDISFPDRFMFEDQEAAMVQSLKLLGQLLRTSYKNLAFVANATAGINNILREFPFKAGETIVVSAIIYESCGHAAQYVAERYGLNLEVIDIRLPMEEQEIVSKFEAALKKHPRLAVFDTICSMPTARLPFEKLTKLCQQYNVVSVIDGAHSIGMLDMDLEKLGCDFWVSNIHKWMYVPHGCAVMYANPALQDLIEPFPLSHTWKGAEWYEKFLMPGTLNYSQFYCIEEALKFVEEDCGGFEAIRGYCTSLARQIEDHFGSDRIMKVQGLSRDQINFMVNVTVQLPAETTAALGEMWDPKFQGEIRQYIQGRMIDDYKSYMQFGWHNGQVYARLSCQVYNELEEYVWGYKVFEKLLSEFLAVKGLARRQSRISK